MKIKLAEEQNGKMELNRGVICPETMLALFESQQLNHQ